jgi:flagellar basal-body rod modification protein FlgD
MSTVGGLDLNTLALPAAATTSRSNELGRDTFMRLMITQLQNQDPTKPLESSEFVAQLAQFSSVSSLESMSRSIGQLSEALYANQAVQASSLIGRNVLVAGDSGVLRPGQGMTGGVDLPFSTGSAVVSVYNGAGEIVRQLPLGPRPAGLARFTWDGTDASGQALPPGTYRFTAAVPPQGGNAGFAADTYTSTRVMSVALGRDLASSTITTDTGRDLRLAQIKAIE